MAGEAQHSALLEVRADVKDVNTKLAKLKSELNKVNRATEKVKQQNEKAASSFDRMGARMEKIGKSIGKVNQLLGAAGLIGVGVAAVRGLDRLADSTLRYQNIMANLPFSIQGAQNATKGLAGEMDLATAAVQANRFGVAKNSKEFSKLAGAATKLALSTGQDAAKGISDLTLALARQSPKILDNLGIILKIPTAQRRYARSIGKTVDQLTDAEKQQVLSELQVVIAQAPDWWRREQAARLFPRPPNPRQLINRNAGIL